MWKRETGGSTGALTLAGRAELGPERSYLPAMSSGSVVISQWVIWASAYWTANMNTRSLGSTDRHTHEQANTLTHWPHKHTHTRPHVYTQQVNKQTLYFSHCHTHMDTVTHWRDNGGQRQSQPPPCSGPHCLLDLITITELQRTVHSSAQLTAHWCTHTCTRLLCQRILHAVSDTSK